MIKKYAISNELIIQRHRGGIQFISPTKNSDTSQSIGNLLNLPISFYLLDSTGNTKRINEEGVIACGFDSVYQSVGKSILDVGKKETAEQLIENCKEVITLDSVKIFEEQHLRKDGNQHQFLSIKCPWYDESDKILGICGFSIVLGKHALANSLTMISKLGLLNQSSPSQQTTFHLKNSITDQLSKRELDCLHYTVKGLSAKRIARELNISFRTVEEYITNIRYKLGAQSKAELIEMALETGDR